MNSTKCKNCEAEIVFCKSKQGKWMPMDATADPDGKFLIDPLEEPPIASKAYDDSPEGDRYTCHFATCSSGFGR